ncbi:MULTISPECIES: Tex family protein [Halomonas]|uniref:RNA-binding transcriptional accessory protein n=2 Tax=Halomonas TaxID=2745 RepID=A0AAU7KK62_9GAMM|nr:MULTISPECIES: Tex family protein [Halomonas]KJZ07765.1 transcription accessory protein [Halomonas sp. S2151]MCJ8284004.1 RNA-binding transcriptional accessory protein [Halomonas sp.]NQY69057.1 RNA-binding transcriptional accessory protein [Halomonas sp.]PTL92743.1 RNA-binding transcriptional accessory protein [Halomonas sp. SYSU XM8]PTL96353.1 RNA-binding transcriptional accessory protein [Halomonas litopenaei]
MDATAKIIARLAEELAVKAPQISATVELLDGGATVPFIARYRKEVTGGLDDTQLRNLEERLGYLRELEERRTTVLAAIDEQGKLSDSLAASIQAADTKQRLEDLYLPYRKKRRTKAQIAREAGLEPLADALLADPTLDPETEAAGYLRPAEGETPAIEDAKAALDGAKQILMERFAEDPELVGRLRERLWSEGELSSRVIAGKEQEGAKFSDYFEHDERLAKVPSHRALAMFRGRNEGVLALALRLPGEDEAPVHPAQVAIARHFEIRDEGRKADRWLAEVVRWTWRVKLYTHLETELMGRLRERAEGEAIDVFAANLKDLLLAAPAGPKATLAIDPGLRTGCKVAVVDATGQFLEQATIFPHAPRNQWDASLAELAKLVKKHGVELIAVGNGTASRETDRLAGDLLKAMKDPRLSKVMVSEAGASVYSASEYASRELPDLDVTIRGAVSIARRLQDPLAELVKIEPKSIGVGQYQHDVSQVQLSRSLEVVIEDCVNAVGVDLNTASSALLSRVAGLNPGLAENIVTQRNAKGAFRDRRDLLEVSRLGPKTFEQCAGFLRIMNGANPLDASAVHPEAYPLVERIAERSGRELSGLIGDSATLKALKPSEFADERFGVPTVSDIIAELDKPGRDPRPEFRAAQFREGVETLKDLEPGMVLEGTVTNVTHFGAFVDIGVHQDGLVHISALSDRFVEDPRTVVKAGDIVKVKVMNVDLQRSRIGLSMRMDDTPDSADGGDARQAPRRREGGGKGKGPRSQQGRGQAGKGGRDEAAPMGALGAALLKAKQGRS